MTANITKIDNKTMPPMTPPTIAGVLVLLEVVTTASGWGIDKDDDWELDGVRNRH